MERNYPIIYLSDNDDQTAKVRIAYSRERDDRTRGEKADGEWTCKIVRRTQTGHTHGTTETYSAPLSISLAEQNVIDVKHRRLVRLRIPKGWKLY